MEVGFTDPHGGLNALLLEVDVIKGIRMIQGCTDELNSFSFKDPASCILEALQDLVSQLQQKLNLVETKANSKSKHTNPAIPDMNFCTQR